MSDREELRDAVADLIGAHNGDVGYVQHRRSLADLILPIVWDKAFKDGWNAAVQACLVAGSAPRVKGRRSLDFKIASMNAIAALKIGDSE